MVRHVWMGFSLKWGKMSKILFYKTCCLLSSKTNRLRVTLPSRFWKKVCKNSLIKIRNGKNIDDNSVKASHIIVSHFPSVKFFFGHPVFNRQRRNFYSSKSSRDFADELKVGDVRYKHLQLKYNSFDVYHMKCNFPQKRTVYD